MRAASATRLGLQREAGRDDEGRAAPRETTLFRGPDADTYLEEWGSFETRVVKRARCGGEAAVRREAEWLLLNPHPGVVAVVAHDLHHACPWFAMPRLAASPWSAAPESSSRGGDVVLRSQLGCVRDLAETLAWLHGRGLVHRDVKPDNVLVDGAGGAVLIDFGAAARFNQTRESLASGAPVGSEGFSAPEQLAGAPCDGRADLYSLGALLFLSLCGMPPSDPRAGDGAPIAAERLLEEHQGLHEEVASLALQLLHPNPDRRVAYADEVAASLTRLLGGPSRRHLPKARPYLYRSTLQGREVVLKRLEAELASAQAGRGNLVVLEGLSGSGKTRVLQSLAERVHSEQGRVFCAGCSNGPPDSPVEPTSSGGLQAFRPFLEDLARTTSAGDPCLLPLLRAHANRLVRFEPALESFCRPGSPRERVSRDEVIAALLSLLHARSEATSLSLLIDDVQWADELTLGALAEFASKPWLAPRCTIVVAVRSEEVPAELRALPDCQFVRLTLEELEAAQTHALVKSRLGGAGAAPLLEAEIHARTAGNPLAISLYLEHLVAKGELVRARNCWKLNDERSDVDPPETIAELISRRLAVVSEPSQRLIDAGAVLGRSFDPRVAVELSGLSLRQFASAVNELHLLHVLESRDDWTLSFAHDRIFEVAYSRQCPGARAKRHREALGLLEDRGNGTPGELARHASLARDADLAVPYLMRAASHASEEGRHRLASSHLEEASSLVVALHGGDVAVEAKLQRVYCRVALDARDYPEAGRHGARGLALLGWQVPRTRRAWFFALLRALGVQLWLRAFPRRSAGARSVALAELAFALATAQRYENEVFGSLVCQLVAANEAERGQERRLASECTCVLACVLGFLGGDWLARRYFRRARHWASEAESESSLLFCDTTEGYYLLNRKDPGAADRVASQRTESCLHKGTSKGLLLNLGACALIALRAGRMERACRYTKLLLDMGRFGDFSETTAEGSLVHVAILLQRGDHFSALEHASHTAARLEKTGGVVHQCCALSMAAVALTRLGRVAEAERHVGEVFRLMPDGGAGNFTAQLVHQYLPEVLLACAAAATGGERERWLSRASRAVAVAGAHCRLVRGSRPAFRYHRAVLLDLSGKPCRSLRVALEALALARRLRQPFEQARALALIADLKRRSRGHGHEQERAQAAEFFQRLGCHWHGERLRRDDEAMGAG